MSTETSSAQSKGLFRSLTRSKSKKVASKLQHSSSSSADGHQPPSLASWGQANAAGATVAAGGLGRAATLREKARAQMGSPAPVMPKSTSSGSLAATAGGEGSGSAGRAPVSMEYGGRSSRELSDEGRHARQPSLPSASYSQQQQQQQQSYRPLQHLSKQPSQSSHHSSHGRQPSERSVYSTESHPPVGEDDGESDYADIYDSYGGGEDDPISPTTPITPVPPPPPPAAGRQTTRLRDGSVIETPLPPSTATPLPFGGRARSKSIGQQGPPPSSFAQPSPPPPVPALPPMPVAQPTQSSPGHSRQPTSASSIDSPMVATPALHPLPLPAQLASLKGPRAETVSQGDLPGDRFVVNLGGGEDKESSAAPAAGGGGWGKVKRGLTVRRKEKTPQPSIDRPPSPPRVAAAPTMHTAATLAMQIAAAERKAGRKAHDPNAVGGGARGKEEERLTESAFM